LGPAAYSLVDVDRPKIMPVQLWRFTHDDFNRLIGWIPSEAFLIQWSGPYFTFPLDDGQLEDYLRSAEKKPPIRKIFKAIEMVTGEVVGHIELNNIDPRNRAATVSKVLVGRPENRGKGYGTEMVRQLLVIAFDEMGLHRVDLKVFDWNEPAIRSYQKLGFTIEGHLRDYRKFSDGYWSSYLMSILSQEWQQKSG
jgi:RimJ/RimL family protein N-acetyltransferase